MKTNHHHTTRPATSLACRLARLRAALTGKRPSHTGGCADCQAWFAAGDTLDRQLSREGRALSRQAAPEGLEHFIMAGVTSHRQAAPAPARSRSRTPAFLGWSGLAAAAAIAAVVLLRNPAPSSLSGDMAAAEDTVTAEEVSAMVASLEALPRRLQATVATTQAGVPLFDEVDSVYADARAALGFLAMNFLPDEDAARFTESLENQTG